LIEFRRYQETLNPFDFLNWFVMSGGVQAHRRPVVKEQNRYSGLPFSSVKVIVKNNHNGKLLT
jgi:hypothetical protein